MFIPLYVLSIPIIDLLSLLLTHSYSCMLYHGQKETKTSFISIEHIIILVKLKKRIAELCAPTHSAYQSTREAILVSSSSSGRGHYSGNC